MFSLRNIILLASFALIFVLTGCNLNEQINEPTLAPTEKTTDETTTPNKTPAPTNIVTSPPKTDLTRTEEWLLKTKDADKMILSSEDIKKYNERLLKKSSALFDIINNPNIYSQEYILSSISNGYIPTLPKYDQGSKVTNKDILDIKENFNIEAIEDEVVASYGIVVYRANLKSLPTTKGFYDSEADKYYDRIQETELVTGTPVHILHTSSDNEFLYVQTYFYKGWVKKDAIAVCENKDSFLFFAKPTEFVTITSPLITIGTKGVKADMGCIFPVVSDISHSYTIKIPTRLSNGDLLIEETTIPKSDATLGFLHYTKGNYITQALKYAGTPYGWGGLNDGVDCSSFVIYVFRSFGFMFPRNTSHQSGMISDNVINLQDLSSEAILSELSSVTEPCALYKKGHVLLYLGVLDGTQYVIHAPQGGELVREEPLSNVTNNLANATIIS